MDLLKAGLTKNGGVLSNKAKNEIVKFIYEIVLNFAFFKDSDFETESEFRICYARHISINKLTEEKLKENSFMNSLDFVFKEGEIIPYITLNMPNIQDLIK